MLKHFTGSIIFTVVALAIGAYVGWAYTGTVEGMLSTLWICAVLAVLETSLSFDNAAVNATVLKDMEPEWQHRFLTWGIAIAVFGMRIVFPIVIVAIAASLGPWGALMLAINEPARYAEIMGDAHTGLMGFGGAFLGMVGLKYFFDADKDIHWIGVIEQPLSKFGRLQAFEIGLMIIAIWATSTMLEGDERVTFMTAGLFGLITFIGVEMIGDILGAPEGTTEAAARSGLASFLYLEVLDASFSFDGVIGAFALSTNLFVIAIGLGIGAMFVRSMTIYLVHQGTMSEYRFLEHGAFYAILALASIMFLNVRYHIPEVVTGLIGAVLIGLAFVSSVRWNRARQRPDRAGTQA